MSRERLLRRFNLNPSGNYHSLPLELVNFTRDEFAETLYEFGYKVGAEIGVERGIYSETLCKAGLKVYAVDPWRAYETSTQEREERIYQDAVGRLSRYECEIIRKPSIEAASDFEDNSLDFVYIDGDHLYQAVLDDLEAWSPKVRKDGIVAGHDYNHYPFPNSKH